MDTVAVDSHNHHHHHIFWDEIARSESLLVCCMFDEAASLASSVIRSCLCDNNECNGPNSEESKYDLLESAGMVFVQSLKELGRTPEILKELRLIFRSLSAIPIPVFLTGVCFQVEEGLYDVREFLEEFLFMWKCVDDRYYVLASAEEKMDYFGDGSSCELGVDKYLQVVEVYVVTLLAKRLRDMDVAISWVEKAVLPKTTQQELLRRLHSLYSDRISILSQANSAAVLADQTRSCTAVKEQNMGEGMPKVLEAQNPSVGNYGAKEAIVSLSRQKSASFWWFRTITLKFGNLTCGYIKWTYPTGIFSVAHVLFFAEKASKFQKHSQETSSVCKEGGDGFVGTRIFIPSEPSCCCSTPCASLKSDYLFPNFCTSAENCSFTSL